MESKKHFLISENTIVNVLTTIFSEEIQGMELGKPEVKMLFNTSVLDYTPGYAIKATSETDVKYLIYSPLGMQINIVDELNGPDVEVGKKYHLDILNIEVDGTPEDLVLVVYQDDVEGWICRSEERAEALIKAFVAGQEDQTDYFKIQGGAILPVMIDDILYWMKPHKGNYCYLVDVANSKVSYRYLRPQEIKLLTRGARYQSKTYKTTESEHYFFNGQSFSAVRDKNPFMTKEEAKGSYQSQKLTFDGYTEEGFAPIVCAGEESYLIGRKENEEGKWLLVINAIDGVITEYPDSSLTPHRKVQLGEEVETENGIVIVNHNGWEIR